MLHHKKNVIDYCINKSKSFIYTSALPSSLLTYSLQRLETNREKHRKKLESNVKKFLMGLKNIGYSTNSISHIIPIIIGNEKTTMKFSQALFEKGVFVQPIRYPTVPKNKARLRISITAWLSHAQIEKSIDVFES